MRDNALPLEEEIVSMWFLIQVILVSPYHLRNLAIAWEIERKGR